MNFTPKFNAVLISCDSLEPARKIIGRPNQKTLSLNELKLFLDAEILELIEVPDGTIAVTDSQARQKGKYINRIATEHLVHTLLPNDYLSGDVILCNPYLIEI